MYHSVYDEKLDLLAWMIIPVFSDQVTYIATVGLGVSENGWTKNLIVML